MTGLTLSAPIMMALKPPTATATRSSSGTVTNREFRLRSGSVTEARTTVRLMVDPMDMSNPPDKSTNCWPRATEAKGKVSSMMFVRFSGDQNTSDWLPVYNATIAISTSSTSTGTCDDSRDQMRDATPPPVLTCAGWSFGLRPH